MVALYGVQNGLTQARIGAYQCAMGDRSTEFFEESALGFGDGYEAIALLLFANITMNVIEHTVDIVVEDGERVQKALTEIDDKLGKEHKDSISEHLHTLTENSNKVMRRLEQMSEKLVHSTWALSTLGIQYFSFTCLAQAIPQVIACQAKVWGWTSTYEALHGFSGSWAVTFKGMGLLGSCVAIHNMVSIESNFDQAFLEGYEAKYKFISVKIMVSIVFIQELFLPIVFGMTKERTSVLDASLRILEFCLISIFNLKAWPLKQHFYEMESIDLGADLEDLTENLIND